ncbi:DUF4261 domain-containing protein [Dysgonomonas sp. 521]|uniref:DUF4261 domain-containing protein n=1 Tax=Dysgonomonas sp. 521 TaxID=2302932 RepID=UPI0013D7EF58|nr:DUF4261 domain-containing protein [Dysgonomonas sp. 521]NDV96277.1 DUF4261 domain-containing protein [Dysgonomonas sp. 521]
MGLFDIFKKKNNDKETAQESTPANSVILAMPLFRNGESYNIEKVIEHLKTFWKLNIGDTENTNNETAVFDIDEQMVAIAAMPAPVPWEEIEEVASYNYLWPNAAEELEDHTSHAIVTVLSGEQSPVERYSLLSKMLCSILMTSNCVGIYQGNQTLLVSKDYYLNCIDDLKTGEIPVPIWLYIGIRPNEDKTVSLYTYGLSNFGKPEIEIINSKMETTDLYDFMLNITSYIIGSNVTLKDGETIGYGADHKVPIKLSKGVYLDGQTLKMEL